MARTKRKKSKELTSVLKLDNRVIHTRFRGVIDGREILTAIQEWKREIALNAEIGVLIFDYTDATMTPLSKDDVIAIAQDTRLLVESRQDLVMIGVMPKDIDTGLTNMWRAYSNHLSDIPDDQMFNVRRLADAWQIVEDIGIYPAS